MQFLLYFPSFVSFDASHFPSGFFPLLSILLLQNLVPKRWNVLLTLVVVLGGMGLSSLMIHQFYDYQLSASLNFPPQADHLPVLPPVEGRDRKRALADLTKQLKKNKPQKQNKKKDCILITGSSAGIGRAIATELASRYGRQKPCMLLTSRHPQRLSESTLVHDLKTHYKMTDVHVIPESIDLTKPKQAERLYQFTSSNNWKVDVLILNAGIGDSGSFLNVSLKDHLAMIRMNMESTLILAHKYSLAANKDGITILFQSSITAMTPGLPYGAVYAATKAYLRSLAWGMAGENVRITVALPGATKWTDFNNYDAAVWNYPGLVSNPAAVAYHTVNAVVRGQREVFPGRWLDEVWYRWGSHFLPSYFNSWFFGFAWRPWPFSFPPGWKKNINYKDEL
mmetsp:Transcript_13482/g.19879  ORF Transcript_13482/g.19879 Transcript_13482/m.19879 type:complete len:395 (+) Transcript_13482:55-1239(+)